MYTTTVGCGGLKEPPLPGRIALLPDCMERDHGSQESPLRRDTPANSVREAITFDGEGKFGILLWHCLNKHCKTISASVLPLRPRQEGTAS